MSFQVCMCATYSIYVCVGVFAVHVFAFCMDDGEHKWQHPTVLLPASLPVVQFPFIGRLLSTIKQSKQPFDS